jgi:asparagine synthase (glutamine-hydrolysing)
MFSIAIYDKITNQLHIFRDRAGIKPLYYYYHNQQFTFSSELKGLKVLDLSLSINKTAVYQYLHLGYIPAPYSIYNNIYKLEKGFYLKIDTTGLTKKAFIQINDIIQEEIIEDESVAVKQLDKLLNQTIRNQLISDVSIGTFLSGGIDSSLITAIASKDKENLNTFSIGFKEKAHNESEYAQNIAKYLDTNHHEFIVSYNDALHLIESLTGIYDEPYADSSAIPTLLVSKMASKHVKVVLSGDGGDELFMGYGAYLWAERLENSFLGLGHNSASLLLNLMPSKYKRISKLLKYDDNTDLKSHIFSQEQNLFSQSELKKLVKNVTENFTSPGYENLKRSLNSMEKQALFDIDYYLPDDLLVKIDRASMQFGLEVRVPYLDNEIMQFALNLSPNLKYNNTTAKYLLKEVLYKYIPSSYFNRPKQGFSIPLQSWLKNELNYLIDKYLNTETVEQFGIVNEKEVQKLKINYLKGRDYLYNRIWLLIILHKWLKENV